jgi:hypothetical protein
LGILTLPAILFAQKGLSHVRVVRLSYVSGTVAVKRPDSTEWAKAMVNTPLQEGFEISTAANSYAEVEFENGSTARLGEFSKVSFDQLAMDEDGNKLNRLGFEQGYATFHLLPEHQDSYSVKMAETTLTPNGKAEFRTDLEHGKARVEVFSGSIQFATASNTERIGRNKVLEFTPGTTEIALDTKSGIVKDSWDKWTTNRDTQTQLALSDQAVPAHNGMYGWSDLDAYGEWAFFPGFGYGWSPFSSMGWAPYSMGMWSFYPGMGYTWISGEPWGWMPYHFGSWNYSNGFGWFWSPTGSAAFSPALVSWYSGPGWIGWAPLGARGIPGQNVVTTTSGSVVQNGLPVGPENVIHMPTTAGTEITHMPFQPGSGAMLPGLRLSAAMETIATPRAGTPHSMAPASILMGGDASTESSLQGKHFNQPLRARMGTTLGGQYRVGGNVGEFRGDAFVGTGGQRGMSGSPGPEFSRGGAPGGPTFVPHGQQSSNSSPAGGNQAISGTGNSGGSVNSMAAGSGGHVGSSVGGHH